MPYDPTTPSFVVNKENNIHFIIPQTKAVITEQGYTYNQAGFSYNQPGVTYGGLTYQNQDVVPTILTADPVTPHPFIIYDQYTPKPTPPLNNKNGPGFLMYVNLT